jgi:hypothetical protein
MQEREKYDAAQEARREAAGTVDRSTRERTSSALMRYLAAEAERSRKAAASDQADRDR